MDAPPVPDPRAAADARIVAARDGGDLDGATALVLEIYGGELLAFLHAIARDPTVADDAWSVLAAAIWRSLGGFAGRSSLRTWLYVLARRAHLRVLRRQRADEVPLSQASAVGRLAADLRRSSLPHLARVRERMADLRAQLDPDDQTILILRVDRDLSWREVAEVLADDDEDLDRLAATVRKRFERIKAQIRALATAAGLVEKG